MCDACEQPLRREIERLRRLTEQQADELAAARREQKTTDQALRQVIEAARLAHAALDAAGAPNDKDLTLEERIAAALPALSEPAAGEWEDWKAAGWKARLISDDTLITVDARGAWRLASGQHPSFSLTREEVARRIGVYRLALGPAGIPPTEPKP